VTIFGLEQLKRNQTLKPEHWYFHFRATTKVRQERKNGNQDNERKPRLRMLEGKSIERSGFIRPCPKLGNLKKNTDNCMFPHLQYWSQLHCTERSLGAPVTQGGAEFFSIFLPCRDLITGVYSGSNYL